MLGIYSYFFHFDILYYTLDLKSKFWKVIFFFYWENHKHASQTISVTQNANINCKLRKKKKKTYLKFNKQQSYIQLFRLKCRQCLRHCFCFLFCFFGHLFTKQSGVTIRCHTDYLPPLPVHKTEGHITGLKLPGCVIPPIVHLEETFTFKSACSIFRSCLIVLPRKSTNCKLNTLHFKRHNS